MGLNIGTASCLFILCAFALETSVSLGFTRRNGGSSFVYQGDGLSTNETYSTLSDPPRPQSVVDVSFCVRIMLYVFKPSIAYIFESGLSDEDRASSDYNGLERFHLLFSLTAEGSWVGVKSHNFFIESGVLPLEWNHFCFAHNGARKSVVVVQNGRVVLNISDDNAFDDTPLPKDFIANVVLGQRQPLLREARISLSGEISHFNLWKRELQLPEMVDISTCKNGQGVDKTGKRKEDLMVDWEKQEWRHHGVTEKTSAFASDCPFNNRENIVMFPEKRGFESANLLCKVLNGSLPVPEDFASNEKLHNVSSGNFSVCSRRQLEYVWLGIQDAAEEGVWRHGNDHRRLRATSDESGWQIPWETRPQEPNGLTKENCAAMKKGKTWIDIECSFKLCTACNFSSPTPRLQLRGLCPDSAFDTHYTLSVDKYHDGKHFFRGYFGSEIRWESHGVGSKGGNNASRSSGGDNGAGQWVLVSPYNPTFVAVYNASSDYPLGKRQWFLLNESSSCPPADPAGDGGGGGGGSGGTGGGASSGMPLDLQSGGGGDGGGGGGIGSKGRSRSLKLTACSRSTQFTCDDGSCISMRGRCDHRQDCRDYSDELDCQLLGLQRRHYIKDYAPGAGYEDGGGEKERCGGATMVSYQVEILSLDEIKELGMTLNVQFRLTMSWLDPRIVFYNLKGDDSMNALTQEEKKKIWIPSIVFNNTDDENESVLDDKARLVVRRKGNYTLSSVQDPDEKYIFSGSQNPLVYSRHHNIQFQCNFDMTYYPFDVQRCSMIFLRNQKAGKFLLRPEKDLEPLQYLGERELLQYYIKNWSLLFPVSDSGFVITITMKRRYLYQLLTTYLPSLCLFCIIHATQYFKISYFHTRIMVSLTGMLVLTTLFLNTSASLPKTSYFKMIDIWMVFGLLLPFFEVVLHTITEYRKPNPREEEGDDDEEEMEEEEFAAAVTGKRDILLRIRGGKVESVTCSSNAKGGGKGGAGGERGGHGNPRHVVSSCSDGGSVDSVCSGREEEEEEEEEEEGEEDNEHVYDGQERVAPQERGTIQMTILQQQQRQQQQQQQIPTPMNLNVRDVSEPLLRKTSRTLLSLLHRRERSSSSPGGLGGLHRTSWLSGFLGWDRRHRHSRRASGEESVAGGGVNGGGESGRRPRSRTRQGPRRRSAAQEITLHFSRTVVPILVLLFNVVYWTVAFLHD